MPTSLNSLYQKVQVLNAPIHFLKKHIIKRHFARFGSIKSIHIHKEEKCCVVTFSRAEDAKDAIKFGYNWEQNRLELLSPMPITRNPPSDIAYERDWPVQEDSSSSNIDHLSVETQERMDQKRNYRTNSPKRSDESGEPSKKKTHVLAEDTQESLSKKSLEAKECKTRLNDEEDFREQLLTKMTSTIGERLALLEERDKLLRIRISRDSNIKTAVAIQGLCPDMCPEKERILRDLRGIVACYESIDGTNLKMDHNKAVKDYARSSADQEEPLAHELRPEPVLTMTMDYIITQIMTKIDTGEEDNLGNWYDFCWYRLRSIRKDIIQQQLCDLNTVCIVERCARFHICCFDRLWGTSKSMFDDKINAETLMNCLQSLMHMYEDLRKQGITCPNEAEFQAYLILLKLNSGFLLSEYQQYSSILQKSAQVTDAVLIHTAYSNNMYFSFFNLMKNTTYLNCCLMQRFLAHLRTKALEIIVRAHSHPNKISRLPLSFIKQTLKFDSPEDCISFSESFGLVFENYSYSFIVSRKDFFFPDSLHVITTPSSLVVNKRVPVAEAVVSINSSLPEYIPHEVHTSFNDDDFLKQGALDATDQEEKLYRDIVERKLIYKRGNLPFTKPVKELKQITGISTILNDDSTVIPQDLESIDITSDEDSNLMKELQEKRHSLSEEIIFEDMEFNESLSGNECSDTNSSKSMSEIGSSGEISCNVESNNPILKPHTPEFKFKQTNVTVIPLSSPQYSPSVTSSLKKAKISPVVSPNYNSVLKKITSPVASPGWDCSHRKKISPAVSPGWSSVQKKKPSQIVSSCWSPVQISQWKSEKKFLNKEGNSEEKIFLSKLKRVSNKSSDKMKRVSLRKYALLWKNKVEKLKKTNDKSLRDYLFYWGASSQSGIPKNGLRRRLLQNKKTSLVVLSILRTNIVDRIDPNAGHIGQILSDSLARLALNVAREQGKNSQPCPIFWKLVFALPPSLKGAFTFPNKLKTWCKAAFYIDPNTKLGDVQYRLSAQGIPTFTSVRVVSGSKMLPDHCKNISAAIVIRAQGWETKEKTQERCDKLISQADSKIPLAILSLGNRYESCSQLQNRHRLSYFHESLWSNTDQLVGTLLNLAHHTCIQNIKVKSLDEIISFTSERLFDFLHQDKYISDELYDFVCQPNAIIGYYNELINKIEKELIACYETNVYGTACEFQNYIKKTDLFQFPSHYQDKNFVDILRKRLIKAKLAEIKWPLSNSQELLNTFKTYCNLFGCNRIFSNLIRIINPPDSNDQENPLKEHLNSVSWLRVVEDIVKEILKQQLFRFNIVYRENKLNDLLDSHWWMKSLATIKPSKT